MTNKDIWNLWMQAHARAAMDGEVCVAGNDYYPGAVQATIYYCMSALGISADYADGPTRQQIIDWMNENNMADEVEYLMEEY